MNLPEIFDREIRAGLLISGVNTTWKVNSSLKDLRDLAQKIPIDSKGLTANLPSRVSRLITV
jgi:hypothetical protein